MIVDTGTTRNGKTVFRCDQCRVSFATSHPIEKCRCCCVPPTLRKRIKGLGDWIANLLTRIGIRKRPGCGCDKRQAWLNRVWFALLERFKSK